MAVIYGWSYADFNSSVGWDKGNEADYLRWENFWSRKVNSKIFSNSGELLTDADDKADAGDVVNEMMVITTAYLRGDSVSGGNIFTATVFPQFTPEHELWFDRMKNQYNQTQVIEVEDISGFGHNGDI